MSEAIQIALVTALMNAAVTWGVISTKLAWLRRDLDDHAARLNRIEESRHRDNLTGRVRKLEADTDDTRPGRP